MIVLSYPYRPKDPMPISSMLPDPVTIAPACLNFSTAVEFIGAMKSFRIVEPAEDYMPLVRILSLIAIGIPSRGDKAFPASILF